MLKSLSRHRIYFVWIIIVQDGVRMPLPSRASEEQTDGVCVVDNAGMCGLHLSAHAVYICLNPLWRRQYSLGARYVGGPCPCARRLPA